MSDKNSILEELASSGSLFRITNKHYNGRKVLDVHGARMENGNKIGWFQPTAGWLHQYWKVMKHGANYSIRSAKNENFAMDCGADHNGAHIGIYTFHGGQNQLVNIYDGNSFDRLRVSFERSPRKAIGGNNDQNAHIWDVYANGPAEYLEFQMKKDDEKDKNQVLEELARTKRLFRITNKSYNGRKVLDVHGCGRMQNGTAIGWYYPTLDWLHQYWRVMKHGDNYSIRSAKDERFAMDLVGDDNNGTHIVIHNFHGGINQLVNIIDGSSNGWLKMAFEKAPGKGIGGNVDWNAHIWDATANGPAEILEFRLMDEREQEHLTETKKYCPL